MKVATLPFSVPPHMCVCVEFFAPFRPSVYTNTYIHAHIGCAQTRMCTYRKRHVRREKEREREISMRVRHTHRQSESDLMERERDTRRYKKKHTGLM